VNSWDKATHGKKFDELEVQITDLDAQIERHHKLLQLEADKTFTDLGGQERELSQHEKGKLSIVRQLHTKWIREGDRGLTNEEWAQIRNTMSTSGASSEGGYTVQTEVARQVIEALKAFGGMRAVAEVFTTEQGNGMNFPQSDGTSETGEIVAENAAVAAADPAFGSVGMPVYKFSSKVVAVPIELIMDSSVDIEAFVNNRLRTRLGRITNNKFTVGSGTGEPRGVVTAADSGKVGTTGQTVIVIYDDIIDLVHSVDPAYRESGKCKFMMNDASVKVIRKIKDTTGRPIWTPGYETGIALGQPDSLVGYPVQTNQDIATMAANAKSILFGDFSYYKIRDVLQMIFYRFNDSAYAKLGQVGFLAFMRSGGNHTAVAGTPNSVKYYQNSAT
jgi:HK97 family phage major capsid protein